MITPQFTESFAHEWIISWNDHDIDMIIAHYADEIVFTSPFIVQINDDPSGTITNKAQLKQYFSRALEKFPALHFELYKTLSSVNSILLYYKSVSDLIAAECMEFDQQGKIIHVLAHYAR